MSKLTLIDYLDGLVGLTLAGVVFSFGYDKGWSELASGGAAMLVEILFFSFIEKIRS
ncbi:hypothetical protein [Rhizobium leguminosarum]|uniref:hypothetical protein n=1 Tax=Rhizobium leguminosarum TaxID=384 RepID=UPI0013EF2975|nr:hypothetical protein [Rhizobium leguminosarum]